MEDSKIESELVLPPSMTDRFDDLESTPSGSPQSNSVAGAAVDVEELKERKAEQNRRKQRYGTLICNIIRDAYQWVGNLQGVS